MRALYCPLLLLAAGLPLPSWACKCAMPSIDVCERVARAEVVFSGVAHSPSRAARILRPPAVARMNALLDDHDDDRTKLSAAQFKLLREFYAEFFPSLANAPNPEALQLALESATEEGFETTFSVRNAYKGASSGTAVVWTDFSSCGLTFAEGHHYLIYAWRDDSGKLRTGFCSGTRPITDAGEHLAYLYYYTLGEDESGRLFGTVLSGEADKLPAPPASDVVVKLSRGAFEAATETSSSGNFVFDGLAAGTYELTLSKLDRDERETQLDQPRRLTIGPRACHHQQIWLPKPPPAN